MMSDAPLPLPDAAPAEDDIRLAEALIFANPTPVTPQQLKKLLPEGCDVTLVLAALAARTVGRGVVLAEIAGGWQFRTAPDLAPRLKRVIVVPRRLPRAAMETLAIVAYHQPVTRTQIEEIRGAALSQGTMDQLLEADLIAPRGRLEAPGRPTLWATTPSFLAQFGLNDLRELPRRGDLLVEPQEIGRSPEPVSPDVSPEVRGDMDTKLPRP